MNGSLAGAVVLAAGCVCAAAAAGEAGDAMETKHHFRMVADATFEIADDLTGDRTTVMTQRTLQYAWTQSGPRRTLVFGAASIAYGAKGVPQNVTAWQRDRIRYGDGESAVVFEANELTPAERGALEATFGRPLCALRVDEAGRVLSRNDLAAPTFQLSLDDALLFHAPHPAGERSWTHRVAMNLQAGMAEGELTYERTAEDGPQTACSIAGTLASRRVPVGGGRFRDVRYDVRGEGTYDRDRKEWTSGKLRVAVSQDIFDESRRVSHMTGPVLIELTRVP
jgi:hypothetical protein